MGNASSRGEREQQKVVLVTGCSEGGIGHHLCIEFAKRGCIVYASARRAESMASLPTSVHRIVINVADDESVRRGVRAILGDNANDDRDSGSVSSDHHALGGSQASSDGVHLDPVVPPPGRIDILVNNAGVLCAGPILDMDLPRAHEVMEVNVFGALRTVRAVLPSMVRSGGGMVVNVGSVVAEVPTPWNGLYCASKAALHSLTETLQMECRPLGVSVVLVAPGSVRSRLADNQAKSYIGPAPSVLAQSSSAASAKSASEAADQKETMRTRSGMVVPSSGARSLYVTYAEQIRRRIFVSQDARWSMPTDEFARRVVAQLLPPPGPLRRNWCPPRYISLGGNAWLVHMLQWLPRGFVLWLMWRAFSR